jgi:hypothetical protein
LERDRRRVQALAKPTTHPPPQQSLTLSPIRVRSLKLLTWKHVRPALVEGLSFFSEGKAGQGLSTSLGTDGILGKKQTMVASRLCFFYLKGELVSVKTNQEDTGDEDWWPPRQAAPLALPAAGLAEGRPCERLSGVMARPSLQGPSSARKAPSSLRTGRGTTPTCSCRPFGSGGSPARPRRSISHRSRALQATRRHEPPQGKDRPILLVGPHGPRAKSFGPPHDASPSSPQEEDRLAARDTRALKPVALLRRQAIAEDSPPRSRPANYSDPNPLLCFCHLFRPLPVRLRKFWCRSDRSSAHSGALRSSFGLGATPRQVRHVSSPSAAVRI